MKLLRYYSLFCLTVTLVVAQTTTRTKNATNNNTQQQQQYHQAASTATTTTTTTSSSTAPHSTTAPASTSTAAPAASTAAPSSSLHQITDHNIHHAVKEFMKNKASCIAQYGPMDQWDVQHVRDFSHLFSTQRSDTLLHFNEDISMWNTSSGQNFSHIFFGNAKLNLNLKAWNVSQALDLTAAFSNTQAFVGHGLSTWDVSRVTSMHAMAHGALKFDSGAVRSWSPKSLVDASKMFSGAIGFRGLGHWTWTHTPHLKNMSEMFAHAVNFNGNVADLDVAHAVDMRATFFKAASFAGDLSKWNTTNVHDLNSFAAYAEHFQGLGLDKWNTSKVVDIAEFAKRSSINVNLNNWDTRQVTNMANAFRFATNMTQSLCWKLHQHVNVDGIFYQSQAHFSKKCVDEKFIKHSCCHQSLDQRCGCKETVVNEDHETEEITTGDNTAKGNSSKGNNSKENEEATRHPSEQQQPGAEGAAQLMPSFHDKTQYLAAFGIVALCLAFIVSFIALKRFFSQKVVSTTTIDCDFDCDPNVSDLDITHMVTDTSTRGGDDSWDHNEEDGSFVEVPVKGIV